MLLIFVFGEIVLCAVFFSCFRIPTW
jgi:hypothetical protein